MTNFIRIPNVAVFDEHGEYTPERLRQIARKNQDRIDDSGDMVPVVCGHTPRRGEDKPQPQIVGFASNFRVGKFGRTRPRAAIYADFLINPKHADLVRDNPRRSIELWPDGVIDPVSILGARTPRRDLGLLTFERSSKRHGEPHRCELDDDFEKFMSQFEGTQIGTWLKGKMRAEQVKKTRQRINNEILTDMQRSKVNRQLESAMKSNDIDAARAALESAHYARENEHGFAIVPMPTPRPVRPGAGGREIETARQLEELHRISRDRGITFAAALRDFKQG